MASSSLLCIEIAPETPPPSSPLQIRRQRAHRGPTVLSTCLSLEGEGCEQTPHGSRRGAESDGDDHGPLQQTPLGPQGAGSSGYMSSCSNVNSPRVLVNPHSSWMEHEELPSAHSDARGRGNPHRRPNRQIDLHESVYSRLDHTPPGTLTRRKPAHQGLPSSPLAANPLVDHMTQADYAHQYSLSTDQLQSNTTPFHSNMDRRDHRTLSTDQLQSDRTPFHSTLERQEHQHQSNTSPFHSNVGVKRQRSPQRTPLALISKRLEGLDVDVCRWILKADQHLKWEEFDNAIPYLESVIVRTPSYPRLQLLLWELLGNAQMAVGMSKKASICHLHHLAHCRSQGDVKGLSRAECNLGITYMQMGLFKLAGRCFLQYLKHCRACQDQCGIESACSNLGLLSKSLALKNYREASERGEEGVARSSLAACLRRAIIFFKQHLEIVMAHGDIEKQGRAYGNIGSCYELLQDYPEAIFYHQKRLEVARATGDMYSELCTLCNLGNCLRAKGSLEQALQHYLMNLEMAQSLGDWRMEQLCHNNLGITYDLLNQLDKAITSYTLFLGMAVQTTDLKQQAKGFSTLARLYLETGQTTKAHEYYLNLVGVFRKLGDNASLTSAELQLKCISQLIKQEKKVGRGSGHTHSKQKRLRAHTLSRASNFHQEVAGRTPLSGQDTPGRLQDLRSKTGTWSMGKKPRPQLDSIPASGLPSEDLAPDPILAMVDMSPTWAGHMGAMGCDMMSSSYPLQPASTRSHDWSGDMAYDSRPMHTRHRSQFHGTPSHPSRQAAEYRPLPETPRGYPSQYETSFLNQSQHVSQREKPSCRPQRDRYGSSSQQELDSESVSSYNSRDYASSLDHTHHRTHRHTHLSEVLYESARRRGGCGYESVGPPLSSSSEGEMTTGRSTALPSLSYCSSTGSLLDVGTPEGRGTGRSGHSEDELTDEEVDHMRELERAGLELARAGLELAGYEVGDLAIEQGADKEWETWQQMNEEEPRVVFGSLATVAGTRQATPIPRPAGGRGKRKQLVKRRLHTASAPNL